MRRFLAIQALFALVFFSLVGSAIAQTEEPTPSPTDGSVRYYFHSDNGVNSVDNVLAAAAFDETAPSDDSPAFAPDLTGFGNGSPGGPYDPSWGGTLDAPIRSLSVDFWFAGSPPTESGFTEFKARLWVGSDEVSLGSFSVRLALSQSGRINRATHQFSSMQTAEGETLPLDVDPSGKDVRIEIKGAALADGSTPVIVFDSAQYPSGFSVSDRAPAAEPDADQSPLPTATDSPSPRPSSSTCNDLPCLFARVSDLPTSPEELTYPMLGPDGQPSGSAGWRVVSGTGNCCENYLAATPQGWLIDAGGSHPTISRDGGLTWQRVSEEILPSGVHAEGAVVVAPNGDILAMVWDAVGDRINAYKYSAARGRWYWSENVLRTPVFDRPWISVVKGPFDIGGVSFPYISILRGGTGTKDVWYYSVDGLNYVLADNKTADQLAADRVGTITPSSDWDLDWIQPHIESGITPLAGGGAISAEIDLLGFGYDHALLQPPRFDWVDLKVEGVPEGGVFLMDSSGRLHYLLAAREASSFLYATSSNGGQTWAKNRISLPTGYFVEDRDFKVHGSLGMSAVAIHAHNEAGGTDQDLVYKLDIDGPRPVLEHTYLVGNGDLVMEDGLDTDPRTVDPERFDFATIVILPDGKIATSFGDADHTNPSIAILQETNASQPTESPSPTDVPTEEPTATETPSDDPSATPSEDPAPRMTSLTFTDDSARAGQYSDVVTFRAKLLDEDGDPISGEQIHYELAGANGSTTLAAVTDETGVGSLTLQLDQTPGPYDLYVRYSGDVATNQASADQTSFLVEKEDSKLLLAKVGRRDGPRLRADLSDADAGPLAERSVTFFSDGRELGTATTDVSGSAWLALPSRYREGPHVYEAVFAGDPYYLRAADRLES